MGENHNVAQIHPLGESTVFRPRAMKIDEVDGRTGPCVKKLELSLRKPVLFLTGRRQGDHAEQPWEHRRNLKEDFPKLPERGSTSPKLGKIKLRRVSVKECL